MHESHDTLDLILGHTEGGLTADQFDTLQQRLRDNAEARQLYRDTIDRAVHLRSILKANSERRTRNAERRQITSPSVPRSEFGVPSFLAAAALLALAATAWFVFQPEPQTLNPEPSTPPASIATLTNIENAAFSGAAQPMQLGQPLSPGPIQIASGTAQVMFASTAVVDLTGPCEFEMTGPNRGKLTAGKLEAYVPESATGFTVDLPGGAKVVDLGTRFRLHIDARRQISVSVQEGAVELISSHAETSPRRLASGEVAMLTQAGQVLALDAWRSIALSGVPSQTTFPTYHETSLAMVFNDPFAYDPNTPTDPRPNQAQSSTPGYHTATPDGGSIAMMFDRPHRAIVIDLYGRTDYLGSEHSRHQNLTIELFNGDWDQPVYTEQGFDAVSTKHDEPASYGRWVAPAAVVADRARITRRDDYLVLMEVRAAGQPLAPNWTDHEQTPPVNPPEEPAR